MRVIAIMAYDAAVREDWPDVVCKNLGRGPVAQPGDDGGALLLRQHFAHRIT